MAKEIFKRDKDHVNVGTMGHVDHGKTTLSAAITALSADRGLSERKTYDQIDNAPEEKERGITINSSVVEFMTDKYHCALIDCPGHKDYVKNTITGMVQTDFLILVVAITDGLKDQSKEHLLLAKQIGLETKRLIVFLNKRDQASEDEEERAELAELAKDEVKEKIDELFGEGSSEEVTFIDGSALAALNALSKDKASRDEEDTKAIAKIEELHKAIDNLPLPTRDKEKPFLLSVEGVYSIPGRGTVVTGRVDQGKLKVGDKVDLITPKEKKQVTIIGLEMFRKSLEEAEAGDNIGVNIRNLDKKEVGSGDIICAVDSITPARKFKAEVYVLKAKEGGRNTPFGEKYSPQIYSRTKNITASIIPGSIKDAKGAPMEAVLPGDNIQIGFELISDTAISKGLRFSIREGGRTVGAGLMTEIIK